jgi:Zn-dependent protease with chaperone function
MNTSFFTRQEAARRSTLVLVLYFILSVLIILLAVDALFGFFYWSYARGQLPWPLWPLLWHDWTERALIGPLFLIGLGTLIGFFQMRTGGHAVARMVGARPVDFTVTDAKRRQLINVVEEMAIASGIRVPALYVMESEAGINAFVAGHAMDEAVLVVTGGSLEHLSRDQLQGVVGHEFSHIFNGDMRLNMRLIAVLTGLLIMGQTGSFLIKMGRPDDKEGGFIGVAALVVGLVLWPLGIAGLLAGRLIKAAISRQREILADASSVQFTRNPEGLAGALLKIRDQAAGSALVGLYAESMSHMCFGPSINLARWYATHPPIEERIRALAPYFLDGERATAGPAETGMAAQAQSGRVDVQEKPWLDLAPIEYLAGSVTVAASIGTVTPAHVAAASRLRQKLPGQVTAALGSSSGAQALLYALMASQQVVSKADVRAFFANRDGAAFAEQVLQLQEALLPELPGLPLVDMALPRLALLDELATRRLLGGLHAFSQLDRKLSVFEFATLTLVRQSLLPTRPVRGNAGLIMLREHFAIVVAVLVRQGLLPEQQQAVVFAGAFQDMGPPPAMPTRQLAGLPQMAMALRSLAGLGADGKRQFMERCAAVVQSDGRFSASEYELLRVVGALVGCPLPLALPQR